MAGYWAAENFWDFLKDKFDRNGFDGFGSQLDIVGIADANAYFGITQGVGEVFFGFNTPNNFSSYEIVAHEITHGIVFSTANLVY